MDQSLLNQSPWFNLTHTDFFGLSLSPSTSQPDNVDWDKFLEDMLFFKFYNFRLAHTYKNNELMQYFLHLVEGKFIVLKSEIILSLICKMKSLWEKNNIDDFNAEYINFVNVSRVIIVYIIQLLCNKGIKISIEKAKKFLKVDTEWDAQEKDFLGCFVKYDQIKKHIDTEKK